MRVWILTGEYPPQQGGVGDYTALLAEHLQALGVTVGVLTARPGAGAAMATPGTDGGANWPVGPGGVPVARCLTTWGPGLWRQVAKAARRADLVHVQYQPAAFGLQGGVHLLPWALGRLGGPPVVTTFHDLRIPYLFPKAGPLRQRAVAALVAGSAAAIFTDPADEARAARLGDPARHYWVPIGPNVLPAPNVGEQRDASRARLGAGPDTVVAAYFGFLNASKGVGDLLLALRRLRAGGQDVRLLLLGGATGGSDPTDREEAEQVERLIGELGLATCVRRSGFLPAETMSAWLLAADLAVLPYVDGVSLRRGSLMACLAHGLPIVSTQPLRPPPLPRRAPPALPGLPPPPQPERVRLVHGESIWLVPARHPLALAAGIGTLASSPALRRRLARGAAAVAAELTWPRIASATLAAYRMALRRW